MHECVHHEPETHHGNVHGRKLFLAIGVLSITFIAELVGGLVFNSLSLVGDSVHVFSDILALVLSYAALTIALRKMPTDRMTYGYHRLEVFSAIFNGVTLVAISFFIVLEAVNRYMHPQAVNAVGALVIAVIGLSVNIVVAAVLHSDLKSRMDINIRGAYLHLLGDAAASLAVIVGMAAIYVTGRSIIDPIVAMVVAGIIVVGAVRVLVSGAGILLQQAPGDMAEIRSRVRSIEHVVDIDDIRFWQVCSHLVVGTAHVVTTVSRLEDTVPIERQIRDLLEAEWNVRHLTLQFETPEMARRHSHEFDHQHRI